MNFFLRNTKSWIFISLLALFAWTTYFLIDGLEHFINITFGFSDWYTGKEWYFLPAFFGTLFRSLSVLIGLLVLSLVNIHKTKCLVGRRGTRNLISAALILEGSYHILLAPSSYSLILRGYYFLGFAYLLQGFLLAPSLTILAVKLKKQDTCVGILVLSKLAGIAFVNYVIALSVNALCRWFEMTKLEGIAFLLTRLSCLGFFNTILLMPLAICLAVYGVYNFTTLDEGSKPFSCIGLSLSIVGVHYTVYLVYSYFSNALNFVLLTDIWTIPFCGLGFSIITSSRGLKLT